MDIIKCVSCEYGGPLEVISEEETATVGEHTFTGTIPALKCPKCGETYTDASSHEAFSQSVALALINSGEVTGPAFRFLRYTLGMTGAALASLLDVAPDTVSRWERGERDVDHLAWAAVAGLVLDGHEKMQRTRKVLEAMRTRPTLAKAVRLDELRPAAVGAK